MSLVLRGLDLSVSQTGFLEAVHQQNSSEWLGRARQQGSSLIDYSVSENRLYERADGSIGLSEKSVGFAIGEQVIRPLIDAISNAWNSCFVNMIWGAAGSLATKNPVPLTASALSCLQRIQADPRSEAADMRNEILREDRQFRMDIGVDPVQIKTYPSPGFAPAASIDSDVEAQTLRNAKIQLHAEVFSVVPMAIQKTLKEVSPGDSWFWYLLVGTKHFVLDVTQISTPIDNVKNHLDRMEVSYWLNAVKPEYIKVFPKPTPAWDRNGRHDEQHEINQMRTTLNQHGYLLKEYGTPLQFINWLIRTRQCFGGWCNTVRFEDL